VEASNSCAGTLIFDSFFFIVFCQFFFPFFLPLFAFFLSVLLSFLLLSNWFLFLSSFVFPLLFRYCFIPVSLAHVVSSLAYPNLLGTKRLGYCCCLNRPLFKIPPLQCYHGAGHAWLFSLQRTGEPVCH
jgi:hypothetical protein